MFLKEIQEYEDRFRDDQIIDGLVNPDQYLSSRIKVVWFLKEAYTDEEKGWHIKKYYGGIDAYNNFFRHAARPTWHPIIYASYSILNDFMSFEDMSYIHEKPEMCEVISSIGIINANKSRSKTGTYTTKNNLVDGFHESSGIIEHQLRVLKPEIHIFGNTFFLYKDYFGLEDRHLIANDGLLNVWEREGKLFLDTYHPASRINKREYVTVLTEAVKQWTLRKENKIYL